MAERVHLDWFRGRIAKSLMIEPNDPAPICSSCEYEPSPAKGVIGD